MGLRTRRASARSRPRTVTERDLAVVCPFSERWLLLHGYGLGGAGTLVRHDLRTGREVEIAPHVGQFAVSPDGTRVAYVAGLDYHGLGPKGHGTLELVDVNTLQHRQLAGPLAGAGSAGFAGLAWSGDGKRIAYTTGGGARYPWQRSSYVVWVRDVITGKLMFKQTFVGGPPSLFPSPDGTRLVVCAESSGLEAGCNGASYPDMPGQLQLVDLRNRPARVLPIKPLPGPGQISGWTQLIWVGWSPSGDDFAYATVWTLSIETPERRNDRRVLAPSGHWPNGPGEYAGQWLGWSPDGRYIGLRTSGPQIVTIDVRTERMHLIPVPSDTRPRPPNLPAVLSSSSWR